MAYDRNLNDYKFEYYPTDPFSGPSAKKRQRTSVPMICSVLLFIAGAVGLAFFQSYMPYAMHASLAVFVIAGKLAIDGFSDTDSRVFQCTIFLFILIPALISLLVLGFIGFNAISKFL